MSDFDAWEPQEPPRGFSERVVREIQPKKRNRAFAIGLALVAAAAAIVIIPGKLRTPKGEITADTRTQRELGPRVIGVLEPGAHVAWKGDELTQDSGDVFYRVEPGAPLVVHTPSGDVKVLGTCFRVKVENMGNVKSALVGSAITAAAFVGVYEGKVAVSHASESVEIGPGESARATRDGVSKVSSDTAGNEVNDDPAMLANANLADQVQGYKRRLETIETQKSKLEKQLGEAQQKLAVQNADGAPIKSEFDLSAEDWAQLSADHRVKFRTPCTKANYDPKPEDLDKLGLAPQDGPVIKDAWARSNARVWAGLKPLCAQAVGSADVAEKIGPDTCMHLVVDMADKADHDGTRQAFSDVGAIRAGQKAMPDKPSATLQTLLLFTGEMKSVEADLAKSLGPDEAHRILYSEGKGLCISSSNWGM